MRMLRTNQSKITRPTTPLVLMCRAIPFSARALKENIFFDVDVIVVKKHKNRSAMRTWGLMLNFIPFGWNAVPKYQHLGVDLLQVKR